MTDMHVHPLAPPRISAPALSTSARAHKIVPHAIIMPPMALLERTHPKHSGTPSPITLQGEEPGKGERIMICRACRHPICRVADKVERGGGHVHTFFNPYGVLFEVGIFVRAPGCAVDGQYVSDFTWFPGYRWRIALCGGCWTHLGWHFRAESGDGFWGLVLSHLDEVEVPDDTE